MENKRAKKRNIVIIGLLTTVATIWFAWFSLKAQSPDDAHHFTMPNEMFLHYPMNGCEEFVITGIIILGLLVFFLDAAFMSGLHGVKRFLVNLIIIAAFFGIIELGIRNFSRNNFWEFRPDPMLIWKLAPGESKNKALKINRYGFREEYFPLIKEKDEYRIILTGDSSAYGFAVNVNERFSDLFEKKLKEKFPHKKIRLINAAVPGYSSFQVLNQFKRDLLPLDPDCVIVSVNNDLGGDIMPDSKRVPPPGLRALYNVLYKSELYLLIRKNVLNHKMQKTWSAIKKGSATSTYPRVSLEEARNNYSEIARTMNEKGKTMVIMSMPLRSYETTPGQDWSLRKVIENHRRIMAEVSENFDNTYLVDVYSVWKDKPELDTRFMDSVHPNAVGHKAIGDFLFDGFNEMNLIK